MFAHVGFEVSDLQRSARFYDAIFQKLGGRRMHEGEAAIAYGRVNAVFWIVARGRPPQPGYGHIALECAGKAGVDEAFRAAMDNGGRSDGPPGPRPHRGPRYYAGYLLDPDGLRVELVSGEH